MRIRPWMIVLVVVFGILVGEVYYLKMLPCSFVKIYYTSKPEIFNRMPTDAMTVELDGYSFNYRIPHSLKQDSFKDVKVLIPNNNLDTIYSLIIIANWVRSKLKFGIPNYNSDEILVEDILNDSKNRDLSVLCDSYTRLFVITCQWLGIPARIIELRGHLVPEAFIRKIDKWVMIDPTHGYYMSKDSELLSVAEMIVYYRKGIRLTPIVFVKEKVDDCLYGTEYEVKLKEIYLNGFTKVSDQTVDRKKIVDTILKKLQLPIVMIQFIDNNSTLIGYKEKMLRYAIIVTFIVFVGVSIVALSKRQ